MEKKEELLRRVGSMQQAAYVRPVMYGEGRAAGLSAYEVKNERMQFTVSTGKCLDLASLSYKGENFNFLAKPGLMGRNHFDTNRGEAQRSIMGGMLFTCGMENICAPCEADGKEYPMHGRIRTTPAEHVSADAWWDGGEYRMEVSGEMREAELFGENLVLRRRITTVLGEKTICIEDTVSNEAFRVEPMYLLYHFNIGWPLLSKDCELILPSLGVTGRDEAALQEVQRWHVMEEPEDNRPEAVFLHELAADADGNTFAAVYNHTLSMGLRIGFNKKELPYFMQWKSRGSGDYVLGLEPANASVYGKLYHMEQGNEPVIAPQQQIVKRLTLTVLDGEKDLAATKEERDETIRNQCGN